MSKELEELVKKQNEDLMFIKDKFVEIRNGFVQMEVKEKVLKHDLKTLIGHVLKSPGDEFTQGFAEGLLDKWGLREDGNS